MEALAKSRLLNNLKRDLRKTHNADESLSILNLSGREIEVTDDTTGITKIVYPRSIFHTNRPDGYITIFQTLDPEVIGEIANSLPRDLPDKIIARIHRNKIRNNFICIETPIKYINEIDNYSEILSIKWINKIIKNADIFVITGFDTNYIIKNDSAPNNTHTKLIILIIIVVAILAVMFIIFLVDSDAKITR
jgi:hypothetical protein